jgi:hypothetical protein
MLDSIADAPVAAPSLDARPAVWPLGQLVRDIARGGIAGIIVGVFVAGLGGRVVMRVAALLHPNAVGMRTENGEVIGDVTLNGTMALLIFGGLGMGLVAGTIWVAVSPWLPSGRLVRALVTAVAAIALGTPLLVQATNPDFLVLQRDGLVVLLLVALVALVGFSMALVDGALDARLPPAFEGTRATAAYLIVTMLGVALILPATVGILLVQREYDASIRAGWAVAVSGTCTLIWWAMRAKGRSAPPMPLRAGASALLLVACGLGLMTGLPHVLRAAGVR